LSTFLEEATDSVNYCCLQSVGISMIMVIHPSIAMNNCLGAKGSGGRRFVCGCLVSFRFGVGGSALSALSLSSG
jgi:hypothetical protein